MDKIHRDNTKSMKDLWNFISKLTLNNFGTLKLNKSHLYNKKQITYKNKWNNSSKNKKYNTSVYLQKLSQFSFCIDR